MRTGRWAAWVLAGLALASGAAAEPPFDVIELPSPGRTASAGIADLDGDGRGDVYSFAIRGVPPRAERELRIHFQRDDGAFPVVPDYTGAVTEGAAAFDSADLVPGAGVELLLLRRDRISLLSFPERRLVQRELRLPGDPSVAAAPDERGLDRLRIVRDGLGERPRLVVPALGECLVLETDGRLVARLPVGHRANFFIPPRPGPLVRENELEMYYDFPRLDIGDVDGDDRGDLIASNRHEIRVFRQRADGGFDATPQPQIATDRLTEEDQIRGTGNVRVAPADLDADGRTDLLLTYTTGGIFAARAVTTVHRNRGGTWDLSDPEQTFVYEGGWNVMQLLDLDGDQRPELIEARVTLSVLEVVELLLTQALDIEVSVRRPDGAGAFEKEPWRRTKLDLAVALDVYEPRGFLPTVEVDLDGDGFKDRLGSGGGEAIEIHLGGSGDGAYRVQAARQELDTTGSLRFGDLDRDELPDLLIFDRTRPNTPIRIARNRGAVGARHVVIEAAEEERP